MLQRSNALRFLALVLLTTAGFAQKRLTLEQASGRGEGAVSFSGSAPRWRWAPDGVHLVKGRGKEAKWVHPETFVEKAPPKDASAESEAKADAPVLRALETLSGVDPKRAKSIQRSRRGVSADGRVRLFEEGGELFCHTEGVGAAQLTNDTREEIELVELAPDGSFVAFVQGNDLHVIDTRTSRLRGITTNGDSETLNGKLDWVYQEEVYGRGNYKAFWWSPDSERIVFLSLDESLVYEFTVVDHIEPGHARVRPEVANYPKAGDPNPRVRVGVAQVETGEITWLDFARFQEFEPLVVGAGWNPDGSQVVLQVQDRIQTWLDLVFADPETGETRTVIHETSKAWVNDLGPPRWLEDGTFLWFSERTGWKHVYHYAAGGELIRPVTQGEWAVRRLEHVDEEEGFLRFTATKDGAVNSNVYRCGLDGGGLARLTRGDGSNSASFREDGRFFIERSSSLERVPSIRLCDGKGRVLRELGEADIPALGEYLTSQWELVEIPARDGFALDAAILRPVPFDPEVAHPVWLPTYSGPDAASVRNRWNGSAWYQFLAQNGFVVLQVNVRTASGKGQWTTEMGYKRFGLQELADLEDAASWITAKPWADAERVGITGYSYGGFMAALALTHGTSFALGIAGGGVYDWRMYDTIYTERYMSTPDKNPEGYDATSVVKGAGNLSGHLLVHAGTMDDNVHMQNLMQLVHALQKAGKSFEMMVYPQNGHGIRDRDQRWFARQMEWRTMQEHLLPEPPTSPAPSGP